MKRQYRASVSVAALISAAGIAFSAPAFAGDIWGGGLKDGGGYAGDWSGGYIGGHTGGTVNDDHNGQGVLSGSNTRAPDGTLTTGANNALGAPNNNTGSTNSGNFSANPGLGGQNNNGGGGRGGNVTIGDDNSISAPNDNTNSTNSGNGNIQAGNGGDGGVGPGGGAGGRGGDITIGNENFISSNNTNVNANGSGNLNISGGAGGAGGALGITSIPLDDDDFGGIAGTHIGYNWQRGSTVFGIEADAGFKDSTDDYLASVRGRLGIASQRILLYGTAGVAFTGGNFNADTALVGSNGGNGGRGGDVTIGNQNTIGSANDNTNSTNSGNVNIQGGGGGGGGGDGVGGAIIVGHENDDQVGFVGGAGVEMKVSGSVSAGIEGLYYTFDDNNNGGNNDFWAIRSRLTFHLHRDDSLSLKDGGYSAPTAIWEGMYLGGNFGVAYSLNDQTINSVNLANGGAGADGGAGAGGGGGAGGAALIDFADTSGIIGGVHIGHNWQRDTLVYGVEADVGFGDKVFNDYLASLRARLGYTVGSHLFYATAGIALAGSDNRAAVTTTPGADGANGEDLTVGNNNIIGGFNDNSNATDAGNVVGVADGGAGGAGGTATRSSFNNDNEVGFVVGGGIESKISDRVSFGVEALYYMFDGNDSQASIAENGNVTFAGADDNDAFVVRGRISFHADTTPAPLK